VPRQSSSEIRKLQTGIGCSDTQVDLYADPHVHGSIYLLGTELEYQGKGGGKTTISRNPVSGTGRSLGQKSPASQQREETTPPRYKTQSTDTQDAEAERERAIDSRLEDLVARERDLETLKRDLETRKETLQFRQEELDMAAAGLKRQIAEHRSEQASVQGGQASSRSEPATARTEEASAGTEHAYATTEQCSKTFEEPTLDQLKQEAALRRKLFLLPPGS
jgi:hypothetical protein